MCNNANALRKKAKKIVIIDVLLKGIFKDLHGMMQFWLKILFIVDVKFC